MPLHVRYQNSAGLDFAVAIERLSDGLMYDFAAQAFSATPGTPTLALTPRAGLYTGLYVADLASTPSTVFTNGDYGVYVIQNNGAVVGIFPGTSCYNGDFATPPPGGSSADPWSTQLPGAYGVGSAGYAIGTFLDGKVSTRSTPSTPQTIDQAAALPANPAAGTIGEALRLADTRLDATVSSRSTYAGGPVQSVTNAVDLNLAQVVPTTGNTANTVADCLNAARAQGFGAWKEDPLAGTLTIFGPDNTTPIRIFNLDSATTTYIRS